ncbi:hypothetical protein BTA51_27395 [Hahella sp. CCB-MM4]|uniref:alpha/beta hydrolase n=1 Tax=Hahella sp. (strain CCB-MM4) TaxID=1926491 RepID=UPI000B9A688E|nr:hypothetical protein [Hahella sp. CCB-MM4]OZG70197.1 hypothetical protein BTA51_27395 [Hahella sp. CCB-MM4]
MGLTDFIDRGTNVIKNLPYLYEVLSPMDTDAPYSEMNSHNYASKWKFTDMIRSSLLPIYAPFKGVPTLPFEKPDRPPIEDNQQWFFLNGICTNQDVLKLNGKALADLFGRTIYLLHNPSDGIVLDLLECAVGRTMQPVSTLDNSVAAILEQALEAHTKVVLIAHSQGGIISARACRILAEKLGATERGDWLKKLELYTFASAATSLDIPAIYAEHYFNTQDYVARIGVAGNPQRFSGKKFEYDATGHLLNTHYLPHFTANAYKSKTRARSRLFTYLDPRRNGG